MSYIFIWFLDEMLNRIVFLVLLFNDPGFSINIMKLTSCWIEKQERPSCFHKGSPSALQISSFSSSSKNNEDEKTTPYWDEIPTIYLTFFLFFPNKMGVLNEKRCNSKSK